MNDLIMVENLKPEEIFTDKGIDPLLERIREEVRKFLPDMTTANGRKEIASQAYRVSQTKTYLEGAAKELTAPLKAKAKVIDNAKAKVKKELDALRDEVRKPLNDWESAEKERVSRSGEYLAKIKLYKSNNTSVNNSEQIKNAIERLSNETFPEDLNEFLQPVQNEYETAKEHLALLLPIIEKNESDARELAALRKKDEERKEADRLEAIKKEAAEKAKNDEIERQESIRFKAIKDKEDAEERALRAEQDKERAIEKAKADEKNRLEAETLRQQEIENERKADVDHRRKINKAANDDVLEILAQTFDIEKEEKFMNELSQKLLTEIIKGNVRFVSVNY